MKYGIISLVLCISTRLRLMTILSLLVKYLVIFHADLCNKSYIRTQSHSYHCAGKDGTRVFLGLSICVGLFLFLRFKFLGATTGLMSSLQLSP